MRFAAVLERPNDQTESYGCLAGNARPRAAARMQAGLHAQQPPTKLNAFERKAHLDKKGPLCLHSIL